MDQHANGGMFILNCPECEGELEVADSGYRECRSCGVTYLARFGHVIRIDLSGDHPVEPTVEHTATAP